MLYAQEESKGLIFNEVYLDKDKPEKCWIEIYNPTLNPLILDAVRYSHIKTINMLPHSIQQTGGIIVKPGEYLIITPAKVNFSLSLKSKNILLPVLANFDKGGFLALTTKGLGNSGIDVFRYGDPAKSEEFKEFKDKPIVNFSSSGNSYSRKITQEGGLTVILDFYESEPTKGSANN